MVAEAGTALGERAERKGGAGGERREVLPLDLENFGIVILCPELLVRNSWS